MSKGSHVRDAIRHRRWRDDESGMSLVEIMIAVFVLSVGLLALASTATTSIVSLRVSQGRQEATDAASAQLEDLRRTDYSLVALHEGDPDVTALGDCTDDVYDEPLVTTSQPGAVEHQKQFGSNGQVTVTTTVSWYDEDDDQTCTAPEHDRSVKRVQVVAEWTDAGKTFTLEESTLVAPVDRGLPAPDFRLGTPSATLVFSEDDVTNETERCVGHVLRNLGADDGYEWTAERTDTGSVEKTNVARFHTANGKFYLRAFLERPAQDPALDPSDEGVPKNQIDPTANMTSPPLELLVDGNANQKPETQSELATGDQARLWVCYWPGATKAVVGDTAEFDVTVSSKFDPNRTETVSHSLEVTNTFLDMYLYDDFVPAEGTTPTTADASTDRVVTTNSNKEILPVLPAGPQTSLEPERLGATTELPNFDVDFDTYPGLRLQDAPRLSTIEDPWPASTVEFHEQISEQTTFGPVLDLDLWSASEAALAADESGATSVGTRRLQYTLVVEVLDKNENQVRQTLTPAGGLTWSYDHTSVGWQQVSFQTTLNGGADFTVADDEYLRFGLTCDAGGSDDVCHLAFDHTSHPSRVRLTVTS